MKLAIWGAGKRGEWFYNLLTNIDISVEIIGYGDNNQSLIGSQKNGLMVYSFDELAEMYHKKQVDKIVIVVDENYVDDIVRQMKAGKIEELYMIPEFLHFAETNRADVEKYMVKIDYEKPRLRYIEYHVSDHCNLNCKGCGHFCPLIKEARFGNLEQYVRDLERIKELCWGIRKIRLMGGEPLLNAQLPEFIKESRRIFPDATISVVSNGLLFPKAVDSLLEVMKTDRCYLDLSLYKPTTKILDKIKEICKEHQIMCNVSEEITEFFKKRSSLGKENPAESYENCISKHCHFLRNGKIAVCGIPLLIREFNDTYEDIFQVSEGDVIDLYNPNLDGWYLVDNLSAPISMCRYCKTNVEFFDWHIAESNPDRTDWLID